MNADDNPTPSAEGSPGTESTGAEPVATTAGTTPGVQSHVPGEDDTDSSIGGVVPDGDAIDHLGDDEVPGAGGTSNGGDSVGDDEPVTDDEPLNGANATGADND